ncbi:MAG: sulfotransferase [Paracoccaceae bacterium]
MTDAPLAESIAGVARSPSVPSVFVLGAGRSGAGQVFALLAQHPELAALTRLDERLMRTPLFGRLGGRRRTRPGELSDGARFWRKLLGDRFEHSYTWLSRPDPETNIEIRRLVERFCTRRRAAVFAARMTGPPRIAYLRALFPRARFVQVVREPEEEVGLRVAALRKGRPQLTWTKDIPDFLGPYLAAAERTGDPVAIATAEGEALRRAMAAELAAEQCARSARQVEVAAFARDPAAGTRALWTWLELREDPKLSARLAGARLRIEAAPPLDEADRRSFEIWRGKAEGLAPPRR